MYFENNFHSNCRNIKTLGYQTPKDNFSPKVVLVNDLFHPKVNALKKNKKYNSQR